MANEIAWISAGAAGGGITIVQSKSVNGAGSVPSLACAFDSAVTAGNSIIAIAANDNATFTGSSVTNWSSNQSDTFTYVIGALVDFPNIMIVRIASAVGGSTTITVTPGSSDFLQLTCYEVSGLTSLDGTSSNNATSANPTAPAISTTAATIMVAGCRVGASGTITEEGTWTLRQEDESWADAGASFVDKLQASAGSYSHVWTRASAAWIAIMAAFK